MLKKSLLAVCLSLPLFAFANGGSYLPAEYHHTSNLYLGVGIARDTGNIELQDGIGNSIISDDGTFTTNTAMQSDVGLQGIAGRLVGGYGTTFMNRYYLGLEGFGELTSNSGTVTQTFFSSLLDPTSPVTSYESWQLREKYSYGIRFIPGIKISESTMLYATVGWVGSRFQLSNTASTSTPPGGIPFFILGQNSFNKNLNGIAAGLGLETMLANNVSIRLGWEWRRYQSYTHSSSSSAVIPDTTVVIASSSFAGIKNPTTDQFYLDLVYHFIA